MVSGEMLLSQNMKTDAEIHATIDEREHEREHVIETWKTFIMKDLYQLQLLITFITVSLHRCSPVPLSGYVTSNGVIAGSCYGIQNRDLMLTINKSAHLSSALTHSPFPYMVLFTRMIKDW